MMAGINDPAIITVYTQARIAFVLSLPRTPRAGKPVLTELDPVNKDLLVLGIIHGVLIFFVAQCGAGNFSTYLVSRA